VSSFATYCARGHDTGLPAYRRLSALRTCLLGFAPYGLRASYDHLVLSAHIPADLDQDPESLVRAVEEPHAARLLWLPVQERYAEHRRSEKRAGRRQPSRPEAPPTWSRGWGQPGYRCPDPRRHPAAPMPEVVAHAIDQDAPGAEGRCPLCGGSRTVDWDDGLVAYDLCRRCGIALTARSSAGKGDNALPCTASGSRSGTAAPWPQTDAAQPPTPGSSDDLTRPTGPGRRRGWDGTGQVPQPNRHASMSR